MKKITTLHILLLILLLSSSLLSSDKSYSFLGIQTGSSFITSKVTPTVALKYGLQTRKYRTSFSYAYGTNSDAEYQTLITQIDTGILANSFKKSAFKPYAGVSFGVIQETDKRLSTKDRGYLYGVNTGLAYIFNDTLDFDLGYRYLQTSKLKNIDSLSDLTLSMHYFY